jgi:hypothetical protein
MPGVFDFMDGPMAGFTLVSQISSTRYAYIFFFFCIFKALRSFALSSTADGILALQGLSPPGMC